MSEMPETELPEKDNDPFRSRCAMLVSLLAMVLAIASLGGNNAAKESMMHNILASNAFAFYQAKNIRQTDYKIAADDIQAQLAQDKLTPAAKAILEKKLEDYKKNIARYESEPETGDGKKELMAKAKEHEHERDHALQQDPWFDYAEALLQIAIVLTSVAILTGAHVLFWVPAGLGLLGILSTVNGFFLFI
jgi:hypothetical protein